MIWGRKLLIKMKEEGEVKIILFLCFYLEVIKDLINYCDMLC